MQRVVHKVVVVVVRSQQVVRHQYQLLLVMVTVRFLTPRIT